MINNVDKDKELSSEKHTLFIKEIADKYNLINKEKNLYEIIPKHKIYIVYIDAFKEFKKGLHSVFNELRNASSRDILEFRISSYGGLILEGQQFYNLIQEVFNDRVVAYLDNHGYSMGALLFCMAKKRVIYPYSNIMFHNYSGGVFGKGQEIESQVKYFSKVLKKFFKDIIVKQGFLTKKEFNEMMLGKDFWLDTKEMCKRKIATHVIYDGKEYKAKEYLKLIKKNKEKKKAKKIEKRSDEDIVE